MKVFFTLILLTFFCKAFAQQAQVIDVAELTIRLSSNEEKSLYYSFAKGDQVLFSFEEADHKTLKEFSVAEAATDTKRFEDYETSAIHNKVLSIAQTGVYKFRIYNSAMLKGRICKLKIQRKPLSAELAGFNTAVKWLDKSDTTYTSYTKKVVTGYREYEVQKTRKVLARVDTSLVPLVDRVERVANTSFVNLIFPQNTAEPNILFPYKTTEVISWAYTLAVGENGQAWYKDANKTALATSAIGSAANIGLVTGGTGALAILAIKGISLFSNPPSGDNVIFSFQYSQNGQIYLLTEGQGNSVAASGRMGNIKQGAITLKLTNDNLFNSINVAIKAVAVTVTKIYRDEVYTIKKSDPIEEIKTIREPKIIMKKVAVVMD